jgi:hypothetical protein
MSFNTSLADLKKAVRVHNQTFADDLINREPEVITYHLESILGYTLVAEIETWKTETVNTPKRIIFDSLARAIAKWCVLAYIPEGEVTIGDLGILRAETPTAKTAYASQIERLSKRLDDDAYLLLDRSIGLFYSNPTLTTAWQQTPIYRLFESLLFRSVLDFNNTIQMKRKYTTFMGLITQVKSAQTLCFDLKYPEIFKQEVLGTSTDPQIVSFREMIKTAVAHFAIHDAIRLNLVTIEKEGVYFDSAGNETSFATKEKPDNSQLSAQLATHKSKSEIFANQAEKIYLTISGNSLNYEGSDKIFHA